MCRLCDAPLGAPVLELPDQPPANGLAPSMAAALQAPTYPLALARCTRCGSVQLTHDVDPTELFSQYTYRSSVSASFRAHFGRMAAAITKDRGGPGFVVDVGSNDGILLEPFQAYGWRVRGIEPCAEIAAEANARGLPTDCAYLTEKSAQSIVDRFGHADLVTATNVFAHVPDLHGFVEAVKILLAPQGRFVFEVYYLPNLVANRAYDAALYHEHTFTHHVTPLQSFLRGHHMEIVAVDDISTHGGSIRVHVAAEGEPDDSVHAHLDREVRLDDKSFQHFATEVHDNIRGLRGIVHELREGGQRIAGYTAPAKATVVLNACGFTADDVAYVVDDAPSKQGRFIPGAGIPIVGPERLISDPPDVVLLFAWNLSEDILKKALPVGIRILVPIPAPHFVH